MNQINKMMSMPFIRIDYILNMEFEEIIRDFESCQRTRKGITDYELFLRSEQEGKSIVALDARNMLGEPNKYDLLVEEFRSRVIYLIQLPDDRIEEKCVSAAVEVYVKVIENLLMTLDGVRISNFLAIDRYLAVYPSLISQERLNEDDKIKIVTKLEDAINGIVAFRANLTSEDLNKLILLATNVTYCYKFYCDLYGIGTSFNLINYLFKMPIWMGTPYLHIDGQIKINFSLLCLHLSFNLFDWSENLTTKIGVSSKTYGNLRFILNNALQLLKQQNTSYYISIFEWFISRIDSDITSYYTYNSKLEYKDLHDIDRMRILMCCDKFSNYRYPVTLESVVRFLEQFKSRKDSESVLKILDSIDYFDFWQLAERLEDALIQIKKKRWQYSYLPFRPC